MPAENLPSMRLSSGVPGNLSLISSNENMVKYLYSLSVDEEKFDMEAYKLLDLNTASSFPIDILPQSLRFPIVFEVLSAVLEAGGKQIADSSYCFAKLNWDDKS